MITGYIFAAFLIILGLVVMRFGSIHVKKFKEGKTNIKTKLSGKISFFSDRYVSSDFKNKKIIHEFKVKKGNYSIYSICDETEKAKKVYSVSPEVGVLLVKN